MEPFGKILLKLHFRLHDQVHVLLEEGVARERERDREWGIR